jgi:hypothetical protein
MYIMEGKRKSATKEVKVQKYGDAECKNKVKRKMEKAEIKTEKI